MPQQTVVFGNWNPFAFFTSGQNAILYIVLGLLFIFLLLSLLFPKKNGRRGGFFILVLAIGVVAFNSTPAVLGSSQSGVIKEPVIEILDLNVNGTGGTWVNITKNFSHVQRIIFQLDFADATFDWNVFAGESSALTNGVLLYYNNLNLWDNAVTQNDEFGHYSYDLVSLEDKSNPAGIIILGRLSLFLINEDGLKINSERSLGFLVRDDISALSSINEFTMTIEGYYTNVLTYFYSNEVFEPNVYNTITLQYLDEGSTYYLKFNTSSIAVLEWINITAKSTSIEVQFALSPDQNDKVLSLWLYDDSGFLERHDLVIRPLSADWISSLLSLVPYAVLLLMGIVVFIILVGKGDVSRFKRK